jgi:hypothetical protein
MKATYRYDYGFVYEYGYNIGLFSALVQLQSSKKLKMNSGLQQRLTDWLASPEQRFSRFVVSFLKKNNITDEAVFEEIQKNIENIFFFGFLQGQHTMRHYIQSLPLNKLIKTEVVYFQINVMDPLNRSIHKEEVRQAVIHDIKQAFDYEMEEGEIEYYQKKGHFLRADSIVLLRQRKRCFLLIIDTSLNIHRLEGIFDPQSLLKSLQQIRSDLGRKTKFSHLSMNTSGIENIHLDSLLLQYASIVKDKTLGKVVQAGSYAYSFLRFMTETAKISEGNCDVSIMGMVDYDYSIINFTLSLNHWIHSNEGVLLKRCNEEYVAGHCSWSDSDRKIIPRAAKEILLKNMIHNTNMDRKALSEFVKEGKGYFVITDRIVDFQNTAGKYEEGETFRDDHASCVKKGLNANQHILYLTGNPGIGKTTVIANELKKHERFLFLYTSCRRTVNDDILLKFSEGNRLFADDLVALSTNSTDEQVINGVPVNVVNVFINSLDRLQSSPKLTYLPKNRIRYYEKEAIGFRTTGDNEFVEDIRIKTGGVLKRLCEGIQEQMENPNIRKIIGTFAIQALKSTKDGTTMHHIQKLFPFIRYSEEMGVRLDPEAFDRFVERYPVCWVMIDEITGTDEGAELYRLLKTWLFDHIYLKLDPERQAKWNLKLIVADASITNETIMQQCLASKARFDHPKIYITSGEEQSLSIQAKEVSVPGTVPLNGWLVNTNSYPAKELNLMYHICVQGISEEEYFSGRQPGRERLDQERNLSEEQDKVILQRVFEYLSANQEEQVIVYIQNINRIEKLKNEFKQRYSDVFGEEAVEYKHYMAITSQLTMKGRAQALEATNHVRCVFMTSSASRGISFKRATKIFAVLQSFSIERELMEQVQLYYRMRGSTEWDTTKNKSIEFFIVDSYVHKDTDEEWHKSKTLIHLLSFLTLVRTCLVSRIFGKAEIGTRSYSVVPLGGRGISPVKSSLIQDVADSIKLIGKELTGKERFKLLHEFKQEFDSAFGSMRVQTNEQIFRPGYDAKNIYPQFLKRARQNLSQLIEFQPFHPFLFSNGMLIFRTDDFISERVTFLVNKREHNVRLMKIIERAMKEDITDDLRKKLVHILELLKYERDKQGRLPNAYVEYSRDEKRYVAFPVLAFTMFESLKDYKPYDVEETFLEALYGLTRTFTDVTSVTPISGDYKNIPFITFKSDALEEVFESRFQQNYLLTSTETNILNLLLLEEL